MLPDDPDQQAQIFYLVLLGMVVAFWVLRSYRDRLGQAVQHAMIWGLIFVGVVLAIGFAEPLKQQLFNDTPQQLDANTIVLQRAQNGHFYADVDINGQTVNFLIDTGATMLVMADKDARTAGIDPRVLSFHLRSQTANGEVRSAPVRLDRVQLAGFTDFDVPATVNGGDLDQSLLGMSYLQRFSSFRVEGDRFFLTR